MPAADGSSNFRVGSRRKADARCMALKPTTQPTANTNKASYHRQQQLTSPRSPAAPTGTNNAASPRAQYTAVASPRSRSQGVGTDRQQPTAKSADRSPRGVKRAASMPTMTTEDKRTQKKFAARRTGGAPLANSVDQARERNSETEADDADDKENARPRSRSKSTSKSREREVGTKQTEENKRSRSTSKAREKSPSAHRQNQSAANNDINSRDKTSAEVLPTMMPVQLLCIGEAVTARDLQSAMTVMERQLHEKLQVRCKILKELQVVDTEIGDLEAMMKAVGERRDNRRQYEETSSRSVSSSRSRSSDTPRAGEDETKEGTSERVDRNLGEARTTIDGEVVLSLSATPAGFWGREGVPEPVVDHKRGATPE